MRTDPRPITAVVAAAAALVASVDDARACGADFAEELLAQRGTSLYELQDGVFLDEVTQLVPAPTPPFTVVIGDEPAGVRAGGTIEERALYEKGAAAFKAGDRTAAAAAFEALLALPPDLRRQRSTWAAYMLGRLRSGPAAIDAYARVRLLVARGFLDELGLAAASLGQEAYVRMDRGEEAVAVRLYAEQAARGDPGGATSLLFVVRNAIIHEHRELAADPIGQRLLATYLYTRTSELTDAQREWVWRELTAADPLAGADQLAAAAYREGRWTLAGQLAGRDPTATLSRWVMAKLALRAGDRATGERLLAEVSEAMAADHSTCVVEYGAIPCAEHRVRGERAIVALAAGRPLEALGYAWRARQTYPFDAIYLAERVLTIDELRAFVDEMGLPRQATSSESEADGAGLREVLARRLMRAGRFAEAAPYFPDDVRGIASAYAVAIEGGRAGDPIERARALFAASRLAREHGLEILGTEVAPDWAIFDGEIDPHDHGYGEDYENDEDHDIGDLVDDSAPDAKDARTIAAERTAALTTALERDRVAASAPAFPHRYHYRYVASELAEQAADLLPHQSQAFAATLCHATRYIFDDDRERVDHLYRRYIREGPAVDFSGSFGQTCSAPEFTRARRFLPRTPPSRFPVIVAIGLWALAIALFARRGRRMLWRDGR